MLASFGKSLGVRRLYVRTLLRIFEVRFVKALHVVTELHITTFTLSMPGGCR